MTLVIPASAWENTVENLRRPPHDRERVVYLDGPAIPGGISVVTTVTVPATEKSAGHFRVTAANMSRAGKHLRRFKLLRLAQVHAHPTDWVAHSEYDDAMAFSQRDGAVSIVVPDYAGCAPGLSDCGVHIREPEAWRRLSKTEQTALLLIVPSMIQLDDA